MLSVVTLNVILLSVVAPRIEYAKYLLSKSFKVIKPKLLSFFNPIKSRV
jgi:hypothetical protein